MLRNTAQADDSLPIAQQSTVGTIQVGKLTPGAATVRTRADLAKEYITVRVENTLNSLSKLPNAFDDITCDIGIDVYRQMLRDGEVAASFRMLVNAVVAKKAKANPPDTLSPSSPRWEAAKQVAEFWQWQMDNMSRPFNQILEDIVDSALAEGSAVGEVSWAYQGNGKYLGRIVAANVGKRPLINSSFVVDRFNNLIGLLPENRPGIFTPANLYIPMIDGQTVDLNYVVPRVHFIIASWNPEAGDPRGRSLLRGAYEAWYLKRNLMALWLDWFEKYVKPWFWGTISKDALPACDENGNTIYPTTWLANAIKQMMDCSVGAFPAGTDIHFAEVKAQNGEFERAVNYADQLITRAITGQNLATSSAEYQTNASSKTHQDALSMLIVSIKRWISDIVTRDLFRAGTLINFGEDAEDLVPHLDLGDGDGFPISLEQSVDALATLPVEAWDWEDLRARYDVPVDLEVVGRMREAFMSGDTPVSVRNVRERLTNGKIISTGAASDSGGES